MGMVAVSVAPAPGAWEQRREDSKAHWSAALAVSSGLRETTRWREKKTPDADFGHTHIYINSYAHVYTRKHTYRIFRIFFPYILITVSPPSIPPSSSILPPYLDLLPFYLFLEKNRLLGDNNKT